MFKFELFKKKDNFKIFILGCQRSGTTLMRLILNSHPKIKCYGETKAYSLLESNKKNNGVTGYQVPIWTELFSEYDCIKNLYEKNDKIIFVFRNPKEVIASMMTLGCYRKNCYANDKNIKRNYLNFEVVPSVNKWMEDENRSFKKRFGKELEKHQNEKLENLFKGICYWNYKNESFFEIKKYEWKVLPVFYENLVCQPVCELKKIFEFLNLPWSSQTLKHHEIEHEEYLPNNKMLGNNDPKRSIDTKSIKKWKLILDKDQIKTINENTNYNYEKLKNYI